LVDHIATLEDQVQRLTEVTTMWQTRAAHLENELTHLTAGETPPQTVPEPPGSTEMNDTGVPG